MAYTDLKELLPKLSKTRHKYEAGFVCAIAGSSGMYGAAKLLSLAALRSGCGIIKLISEKEVDYLPYEIVNLIIDFDETESILQNLNVADSVLIGPGIGREEKVEKMLGNILPKIKPKLVLDADALHFFSNNNKCLLPKETILTPHKKEMLKLLNITKLENDKILIEKTKKFSQDHNVIIVLKGHTTTIFHPQKDMLEITGGDPGLATAGSGDVLAGMIVSFLSQKLNPYEAAVLAVKMHFLTAEIAVKDKTSYGLIASDLIDYLPECFKKII